MITLIATRLLAGLATLLAASIIIFATMELLPGDAATQFLGRQASDPAALAALREEYGLDRPAVIRYGDWVAGVVRLDFGRSVANGLPVTELISAPLARTAILLVLALLLMFPVAVAIGIVSALRSGTVIDASLQGFTLVMASLPSFVVGIALILAFSFSLKLLPAVSNELTPAALVLPLATLVLGWMPLTARMVRAGVVGVLQSDYVHMARLKGLPERRVLRSHVLPNSMVPAIQAFALTAASMPAGIVIVEYLFAFQGTGSYLIQAVQNRDTYSVEAVTLILVTVYIVANLIADIATVLLTPRLRTEAVG
ncbi:MAG: ABC transporter permease [Gaiellales bacterium]